MSPVSNLCPCPQCGEIVIGNVCPYCRYSIKTGLTMWSGGVPNLRQITIRLVGSTTDTTTAPTVTVPNITVSSSERIVVVCLGNEESVQGVSYLPFNMTWGTITAIGNSPGQWELNETHTTPTTATTITVHSPVTGTSFASGTNDLVVEWSSIGDNLIPEKKIVIAAVVSGAPDWYFLNQPNTEGNSDSPLATSVLMRVPRSITISPLGTVGPSTDDPGTWGGGFTSLARVGTTTGTDDRTLDVPYIINTSIATNTASKSGMTSRPWLIVPTIFDDF